MYLQSGHNVLLKHNCARYTNLGTSIVDSVLIQVRFRLVTFNPNGHIVDGSGKQLQACKQFVSFMPVSTLGENDLWPDMTLT